MIARALWILTSDASIEIIYEIPNAIVCASDINFNRFWQIANDNLCLPIPIGLTVSST
jgi:hypothetical protein